MNKVLVVEDLEGLRKHVTDLIRDKIDGSPEVIQATNGKDGVDLALTQKPDLIIMDISMPDMNGINAAKAIWAEMPSTRILFWSQYHKEVYVREIGRMLPDEAIHGYALKTESDEKLVYAITSVLLNDNPYIDPTVRKVQSKLSAKDSSLTDVEYEALLDSFCGLTDKAIAARRHISVRGVQNRLSMVLNKLLEGEDTHTKESAGIEIYNPRTRLVFQALKRGLLDLDSIEDLDSELSDWLDDEYDYRKD